MCLHGKNIIRMKKKGTKIIKQYKKHTNWKDFSSQFFENKSKNIGILKLKEAQHPKITVYIV